MTRALFFILIFFTNIAEVNSMEQKIKKTEDFVPHELVVKFRNSNIKTTMMKYQAEEKKEFRASGAKLLKFLTVVDLKKVMKDLKRNPNVEYVEKNSIYKLLATPNDEEYSKLYGMENMSMPQAWETNVGSRDILVGVIDSGVDYNHPDLKGNYWANVGEIGLDADGNEKTTNGIDDDKNGYIDDHRGWDFINNDNDPMDGHGHGTHCAGSIGAVGNNGIGVVGINWRVSLVGLKIFSDAGSTTLEAITEAIEYSTKIGVDVTNNSWGGGPSSRTIRAAIAEARDHGILFVAAAGNSSSNNDEDSFFPANHDLENIISVAATDSSDKLAGFSNYGKKTVDVGAPGMSIYSTQPGGGYQIMSGTSMAAPHITGLVALIKAKFPNESMDRIKKRVIYTGDSLDNLSSKLVSGKRANALFSLQKDEIAPGKVQDLAVVENEVSSVEINFDISGDDDFKGLASEYEVRVLNEPITHENWALAAIVLSDVFIQDGRVSFVLDNLDINSMGYVAVRALDDVGNASEISESIQFRTLQVEVLHENNTDSLEGVVVTGTWGLETLENGSVVFSDSPEEEYGKDADFSLTMVEPVEVLKEKTFLKLQMEYELEIGYDYGYVEVSLDGTNWIEVAKYNGKSNGVVFPLINISDVVSQGEFFQIRFRITSDSSVYKDGWKIDSITVLGA